MFEFIFHEHTGHGEIIVHAESIEEAMELAEREGAAFWICEVCECPAWVLYRSTCHE